MCRLLSQLSKRAKCPWQKSVLSSTTGVEEETSYNASHRCTAIVWLARYRVLSRSCQMLVPRRHVHADPIVLQPHYYCYCVAAARPGLTSHTRARQVSVCHTFEMLVTNCCHWQWQTLGATYMWYHVHAYPSKPMRGCSWFHKPHARGRRYIYANASHRRLPVADTRCHLVSDT
jgi:hypothetical protein